jgi:hypothetical protein
MAGGAYYGRKKILERGKYYKKKSWEKKKGLKKQST